MVWLIDHLSNTVNKGRLQTKTVWLISPSGQGLGCWKKYVWQMIKLLRHWKVFFIAVCVAWWESKKIQHLKWAEEEEEFSLVNVTTAAHCRCCTPGPAPVSTLKGLGADCPLSHRKASQGKGTCNHFTTCRELGSTWLWRKRGKLSCALRHLFPSTGSLRPHPVPAMWGVLTPKGGANRKEAICRSTSQRSLLSEASQERLQFGLTVWKQKWPQENGWFPYQTHLTDRSQWVDMASMWELLLQRL